MTEQVLRKLKKTFRGYAKSLRPFIKPTAIVFAILLIGSLSILRANFNYIDDLDRAFYGTTGWENFSRHLTNILAQLSYFNSVLTDTSPLPQLITLAIMAISGVMILFILTGKQKFTWIELALAAMLTLNPYFLECLSYKFDAPYIALSVLLAILPFLFLKKSLKQFSIVSILCLIGVCTTYQVSLAIYPMLVVVLALKRWTNNEPLDKIFQFLGLAILSFIVGVLFFKLFLLTEVDSYISASLPAINQIIPNTIHNFLTYYRNIYHDFRLSWIIIIMMLAIGFVCRFVQCSQRHKVSTAFLSILAGILLGVLCFGVYPLFEIPLFNPRAMYGFTTMVVILGVCAVNCEWRLPRGLFYLATVILGVSSLNLSLTYGNALAYYQEYVDFRNELILNELNTLPEFVNATEPVTLRLAGEPYSAPVNQTALTKYPILKRLLPDFGRGTWMWGYYKLEHYYGPDILRMQPTDPDFQADTCPVLRKTAYFTICGTKRDITVILK